MTYDKSILGLTFSADGLYLISWDASNCLRVWPSELQNGRKQMECVCDMNFTGELFYFNLKYLEHNGTSGSIDAFSPVRLATALGNSGLCYFLVPKDNCLIVLNIYKQKLSFIRMITRHYSRVCLQFKRLIWS